MVAHIDPNRAAGDYTAGDLDREEAAAVEHLLPNDPALQRDAAFWRSLRGGLTIGTPDPDWAPRADFARSLRKQAVPAPSGRRIRFPLSSLIGMAAAACLGIAVGWWQWGRPAAVNAITAYAWQEDGGAVSMPAPFTNPWSSYMRLAAIDHLDRNEARPTVHTAPQVLKPWLGVWTKPVIFAKDGVKNGEGVLIVRVVEGSPAWLGGLRPGDVILHLNQCSMYSEHCIAHQLVKAKPGDSVTVEYWASEDASIKTTTVVLSGLYE